MQEFEESFGIVPLKKEGSGWSVFLIQHRKGRYWGFPKGHAEPEETPMDTARRELFEETGLKVLRFLTETALREEYVFLKGKRKVFKKVAYFLAEVEGEEKIQEEEIFQGLWVPFEKALSQVTHPEGREILLEAAQWLPS